MEKSQFEVCSKVLKRLQKEGALEDLVLIGSWCAYFYKYYFTETHYEVTVRTRDLDLLAVPPLRVKKKIDIPQILNEMGFVTEFKGSHGFIRLIHPELFIEFLVPELGRGGNKPFPLPQLGVNAQPLRFLNFLTANIIHLQCGDLTLKVPHPANFAFHKFIIFQRRKHPEKIAKDKEMASRILGSLMIKGEQGTIRKVFDSTPKKWQARIILGLEKSGEKEILNLLNFDRS